MFQKIVFATVAMVVFYWPITCEGAQGVDPSPIAVAETSCEYSANPLGIDAQQPRFTWVLQSGRRGTMQQAYRVLVASSPEKLDTETGDLWDSGKVASEESVNIVYQGKELASRQIGFWKVRVWNDRGQASPWSRPASFEMGLLEPSDWHGQWIGLQGEKVAAVSPLLRKEIVLKTPVKCARLYAAGIGWSEYYINGKRVGDNLLDPATTDYDKRILYVTHDVTHLLHPGANALGVMLGNGWYSPPPPDRGYGDAPQLLLELVVELADGTIERLSSDETWRASTGPIVKNDIWGGETYDAQLEKSGWTEPGYDDASWPKVAVKKSPGGRLEAQMIEPIKRISVLKAKKMTNPTPNFYVYDFGQYFGGWARLKVKGPAGAKIALRYADSLYPDTGLVNKEPHYYRLKNHGATDYYILKGDPAGELYEPRFTFHPFRYVQVEGLTAEPSPADLEGCVIHSAIDSTVDFRCSNKLLNQIHRNCMWSFTNAMYGIPVDAMFREHYGWLVASSDASTFFSRRHIPLFWTKNFRDVQAAQHADGVIPDVVPNYPQKKRHTGDPAFAGNYPILVWNAYQRYNDRRLLEENYTAMKRWLDYLTTLAEGHLLLKGGYYNDHMIPGAAPGEEVFLATDKETPAGLLWSGFYYMNAWIMSQSAHTLGKTEDAATYGRLAEKIRSAVNEKYLDASGTYYGSGSQTSNIFALAAGVVPNDNRQAVANRLIDDISQKSRGHLQMGDIGVTSTMDALTAVGGAEVLYRAAVSKDYPGWGYMVSKGATSIWESWGGPTARLKGSLGPKSHFNFFPEPSNLMYGTIDEFFFNDLAGIEGPDYFGTRTVAPGYREIRVRPRILGDLTSAAAEVRTVRGIVAVDWKRTDQGIVLKATIPVNATAKISIPKLGLHDILIEENGKPAWQKGAFVSGAEGIAAGNDEQDYVSFDTGSGNFIFTLRGSAR